ncbi:hypothetical protein PO002_39855 [Cupriavidus necator]|uniref:glycine zipper domain-containing protein n=1 Tax=Cupriavidus necator TaxID=106590 RepID=UPI0039C21B1D
MISLPSRAMLLRNWPKKTADVAKRVTGRVKDEWQTRRERAESFVHANAFGAVGAALGIGMVLGALLFSGSHR